MNAPLSRLLHPLLGAALLVMPLVPLACGGPDFTTALTVDSGAAHADAGADVDYRPIIVYFDDANATSPDGTLRDAQDGSVDATIDGPSPHDGSIDTRNDAPAPEGSACSGLQCDGGCVPNDPHNCGTCGNDCTTLQNVNAAGLPCKNGACVYTCSSGFADCANASRGCSDNLALNGNCGSCGATCAPGTLCSSGQCVCNTTSGCTGCCSGNSCIPFGSQSANGTPGCGMGGNACGSCPLSGETCATGMCACPIGLSMCPSGCVNVNGSDDNNCGACGRMCTTTCTNGLCAPKPVAVAPGRDHTCALLSDATVWCWGDNTFGQLGNGSTVSATTPVPVSNLTGVTAVAAGDYQTCALLSGGTVACWGRNDYGQLGTPPPAMCPSTCYVATPLTVPGLNGVTAIANGHHHVCALLSGGTVACWGRNVVGQLGNGTTVDSAAPVQVFGLTGARAISAGYTSNCAVISGGSVSCWGDNSSSQLGATTSTTCTLGTPCSTTPVTVPGLNGVVAIASGLAHKCVVLSNGTVSCWGDNVYGEAGNGTTTSPATPGPVSSLSGVTAISAGDSFNCALLGDGSVQCWGSNELLRLDNTTTAMCSGVTCSLTPISTLDLTTGVLAIGAECAGSHACALLSGNKMECWGNDSSGQIGDGTINPLSRPASVKW